MNRIKVERNRDYTTISNVFLRDKSLSLKAKGFLAMVMGLPDDWVFSINGIVSITKEGRTSIYSTINELKRRGYCNATECHDEAGKFAGYDYTFSETPQEDLPHTENPDTDKPHTENQPQLNKDNNQVKKGEKKEVETLTLPPHASVKFLEVWHELRCMPKWKKKSHNALQMNLNKLGRYDDEFAIELMENAIAGDYQGVVFADTDQRYKQWQDRRSGRFQNGYRQEKPKSAFRNMMDMLNDINGVKEAQPDEQ